MTTRRQFHWFASLLATQAVLTRESLWSQDKAPLKRAGHASPCTASGKNVVATVHPLASQSAIDIYRQGGNAVDAAISAALCLSVVDGHNSGIGGGCLMLVRTASGKVHAIDGRETAPARSNSELYVKQGKPSVELSQTGALACAVPGQIAALHLAHQKFGHLPWAKLFHGAIQAAEKGYAVGEATHGAIKSNQKELSRFEASRKVLLDPTGKPWNIGDNLVQKDLARTMTKLAEQGPDWFYRGEFANRCDDYLKQIGGVMTKDDLHQYRAVERVPVRSRYRNHTIIGFPPPSSGGVHIAQMLNMLEHYDLQTLYHSSPSKYYHLLAECMKRAFADRAFWLGDSDFVSVPSFLTERDYANSLVAQIDREKATAVSSRDEQPANDEDKKHTTHLTTADEVGNWVALTCTINTGWGSKVMVPETGVMLNNQMDDFSLAPGVPNAFGLVGSQGNAIAPGKRPLSSMSPTMVLDDKEMPVLSAGAAGGPKIINATLQTILNCIDLDLSIDQAIAHGRIHHQWRPDTLTMEQDRMNDDGKGVAARLTDMGHQVANAKALGIAQGIQALRHGLQAASDPRADSSAMAFDS